MNRIFFGTYPALLLLAACTPPSEEAAAESGGVELVGDCQGTARTLGYTVV